MPRKCTICNHAKRQEIERKLANPKHSFRNIAEQFAVSLGACKRHTDNCIAKSLSKMHNTRSAIKVEKERSETEVFRNEVTRQAKEGALQTAVTVEGVVSRLFEGIMLLYDACDRDLRDPDDDTAYSLAPRAAEVRIIYEEKAPVSKEGEAPKWIKKSGTLQELLDLAFAGSDRRAVRDAPITHHDRAKLLLDTVDRMSNAASFLAKLEGRFLPVQKELGESPTIQLSVIQNILIQCGLLPADGITRH
jgi:hypothetical protein